MLLHANVVKKLRDRIQTLRIGNPLDKNTDIGAINNKPQLEKIRELGLPFWLAGSYGHPDKLAEARQLGAAGFAIFNFDADTAASIVPGVGLGAGRAKSAMR